MNINRGLDHVAVRAYDLDATVAFYTDGIGFRYVTKWCAPGAGVNQCVFLDAGDGRIVEIFDALSTPPGGSDRPLSPTGERPTDEERARHASLVHFAVRTDDPDALFERAVTAGARPIMSPTEIETSGPAPMTIRVAFVHGPNDEVVEFIRRPDFIG